MYYTEKTKTYIEDCFELGDTPTLEEVAQRAFDLSPRTYRRRLAKEGTNFSSVIDAWRKQRAELLVQDSALTLTTIGLELGYKNVSAFTRAYRRWYGVAPAAVRKGGSYWRQSEHAPVPPAPAVPESC